MSHISAQQGRGKAVRIELPMPPSLWNLYRGNGARRSKTKEYRAWITEAGWMLVQQRNVGGRFKRFAGDVEVTVRAYREGNKGRDLDNILKAILDLLTSTGTIADDKHVVAIDARWTDAGTPCTVTVREAA